MIGPKLRRTTPLRPTLAQHNWMETWDGKYGIRDNYKLIISVFAAWRL